jgi:hypothetical protein
MQAHLKRHGMALAEGAGMHIESPVFTRVSVSHSWLAAIAAASIGVAGCGDDGAKGAGPAEAQQRIQATLPGMADAVTLSMDR